MSEINQSIIEPFSSSPDLKDLFAALSKAQSIMKPAVMDMKNPHFNSKYASLTACQDSYLKPLTDNGLTIIQQLFSVDEKYFIRSILGHAPSGQWMANVFKLITDKNNMQGLGSAITYGRRYGANSLIGVVDTEDDDGNAASPKPPQNRPASGPPGSSQTGPLTEAQIKRLFAIAASKNWSNEQVKFYMTAAFELESTKDLNRETYDKLVGVIENSTYVNAIRDFHDNNPKF